MNSKSIKEFTAEIRNKLQAATTALELIKADKKVPKVFINKALQDLEKVSTFLTFKENKKDIQIFYDFKTGKGTVLRKIKNKIVYSNFSLQNQLRVLIN